MLTDNQVRALLAAAMAYDNRKPGAANIAAWTEAAHRGRWPFHDALEAIHEHYARSTDFLMPGHITERLRAERRQPAPVREILSPQLAARIVDALPSVPGDERPAPIERTPGPSKPARRRRLDPAQRAAARAALDQARARVCLL
jgi:hypothetical protein